LIDPMRKAPPPWTWTAAVAAVLSAVVAGATVVLARRVEHHAERPPGNRVEDAFRQTARRIAELEALWQQALESAAGRMLESVARDSTAAATGVVQASWLNPALSDPARAHRRGDGEMPVLRPVLERFARGEPDEWSFSESEVLHGTGWVEQPNRPLAWRQGNGRTAVVLLLDTATAARTVERDLTNLRLLPAGEPGFLSWRSPSGSVFASSANVVPQERPDEILRHVSRFGDWTLHRHYPVRSTVAYHLPVLAGGLAVSLILLGGGAAMASWQRKATRLAEARVSFVNQVSHELRTPLTNLLLNTDLALDGLPAGDGKVRRRLGLIRQETSRLSRIVDNVLAFARVERGTAECRAVSCDPRVVLGEVKEIFAPLFERKSIRCRYDETLDVTVATDRDALAQILSNLLSNVEKYAGEGAKAAVRLAVEAGQLVAEVEDDGPGIPDHSRKRVFLPFQRGGSRVDEGASGTGLGLAISRELAERMGGRLELLPTAAGSKFRLTVPVGERSGA
jgi:signal transduction histidine kinase